MTTRALSWMLAFLRIAAGLALVGPGLHKLGWFSHPGLQDTLTAWAAKAHNPLIVKYLALISPHHPLLARLVVLGELGLGALLVFGLLTPVASLLAFFMVANFHFASGQMLSLDYVTGQSGLVFLLVFPVLFFGRAGTTLGIDGLMAGSGKKAGP